MRINHNIQALNAYRNLSQNQNTLSKHLEKLSSGLRINRAADDAAGLAISEKMRSQIRGLDVAERNALDGISLIQTAEGALNEVHSILQRMRELSVQSANDTNKDDDRVAITDEVTQLKAEIDRIATETEFNTKTLLDGTADTKIHIGANKDQTVSLQIDDMQSTALGLGGVSVGTQADAETAISLFDDAIKKVSVERSKLGAIQNRLEHTVNNLGTSSENLTSAESRIRDADMALEMANYTKNNIISQAATSMLAQANQLPQGILQLLK